MLYTYAYLLRGNVEAQEQRPLACESAAVEDHQWWTGKWLFASRQRCYANERRGGIHDDAALPSEVACLAGLHRHRPMMSRGWPAFPRPPCRAPLHRAPVF